MDGPRDYHTIGKLLTKTTYPWAGPSQQEVPVRNMVLPPKTGRVWEGPEGERRCHNIVLLTSHNPSHWNPCWLRDAWATRKDPEIKYGPSKMTGQRQPGN